MSTLAIIQARMGSSRLPGKVLERFAGKTALAHVVDRTRACAAIDDVVIATTSEPADDVIVEACRAAGWRWSRGSEHDVLDRYYQAALPLAPRDVVRITSDCPLLDPDVLTGLLARYRHDPTTDYASTSHPRPTFPVGISAEVMRFDVLAQAWRDDDNPAWREHVTPFIYRHPERFHLVGFGAEADYSHLRWTLDTPEDARLIRTIFDHFVVTRRGIDVGWREVLAAAEAHPAWQQINAGIVQKQVD
jgi:spore coat polysaccharide biosynthesis protein SpsF